MDPGRGPAPRAGNPSASSSRSLWVEPTGWAPAGSPGAYPNLAWLRIAFGIESRHCPTPGGMEEKNIVDYNR